MQKISLMLQIKRLTVGWIFLTVSNLHKDVYPLCGKNNFKRQLVWVHRRKEYLRDFDPDEIWTHDSPKISHPPESVRSNVQIFAKSNLNIRLLFHFYQEQWNAQKFRKIKWISGGLISYIKILCVVNFLRFHTLDSPELFTKPNLQAVQVGNWKSVSTIT